MSKTDQSLYGDRFVGFYDDWYPTCGENVVNTLMQFAFGGRVLELGIGTGRIALPLAENNIDISGIEGSSMMIAKLKEKCAINCIPVKLGNFMEVDIEGEFSLIYIVFNTIYSLLSQEEQLLCFRNVAKHLPTGGHFILEMFVPNISCFNNWQAVRTTKIGSDNIVLDVSTHNYVNQTVHSRQVVLNENGKIDILPVNIRYIYPSELDLMAKLAGFTLKHRWGGWLREPFASDSSKHVTVYQK